MLRGSANVIKNNNSALVFNFDKNGIQNYIRGAVFLEMHNAFRLNKIIYTHNDIPDGILKDEITSLNPIIINGNLKKLLDKAK